MHYGGMTTTNLTYHSISRLKKLAVSFHPDRIMRFFSSTKLTKKDLRKSSKVFSMGGLFASYDTTVPFGRRQTASLHSKKSGTKASPFTLPLFLCKIAGIKLIIFPSLLYQLVMCASFDDTALF